MKKTATFKLIEGSFTVEEAKELLTNLYSDKIQFHSRKNFSTQERFGHSDTVSVKRIPELKEILAAICALLDKFEAASDKLNIHANIAIVLNE
ncbi:hypothetical protein [Hydrotalea sp.]|uniref:hypothetical protein n=1 Tax=Hydrotalea sp. TaxID=2881279 RepID=UPI0026247526|nr:hypothetical protein [Hydrotalea sp.]